MRYLILFITLLFFQKLCLFAQKESDTILFSEYKVQYKIDIGLSVSNQSLKLPNVYQEFPFGGLFCFRANVPKWKAGVRYRGEMWFPLSGREAATQSHLHPRVSHYYIQGLDFYKDFAIQGKNLFDLRVGAGVEFISPYWEELYPIGGGTIYKPLSLADIFVSVPFGYSALELRGQYAWNDNKPGMFRYSYVNLSWYYSFPRHYRLKEKWVKK